MNIVSKIIKQHQKKFCNVLAWWWLHHLINLKGLTGWTIFSSLTILWGRVVMFDHSHHFLSFFRIHCYSRVGAKLGFSMFTLSLKLRLRLRRCSILASENRAFSKIILRKSGCVIVWGSYLTKSYFLTCVSWHERMIKNQRNDRWNWKYPTVLVLLWCGDISK